MSTVTMSIIALTLIFTLSRTEQQTAQETVIYWPNPKSPRPPPGRPDSKPPLPNFEIALQVVPRGGTKWHLTVSVHDV